MLRESVIQWQCKSGKDGEKEAESSPSWNLLTTWEILPIYRAWFTNLLLILSIKSLNFRDKTSSSPYQGLIFREIKDLETGKFVDKYIFYVFSVFMYLSITNFLYAVRWQVGGIKILDGSPWS